MPDICVLCDDDGCDVLLPDGSPAHLSCVQHGACADAGHPEFRDSLCWCGALEYVRGEAL